MTDPKRRFSVIIPAHDEELLLPRLLKTLSRQHYPNHLFNVYVIADNCRDSTASIGRHYGATVLERSSSECRGKGYAIKYALETIHPSSYDAIFIVDADSLVDTAALKNLDLAIEKGSKVIQCYNGVANPNESWFTCLMDVSRAISNHLLEPAKEKLGLSSHLMGNGMAFTKDVIVKHGWDAYSVGEDWEYYAKIVSRGQRVAFAGDVRVYHQESQSLKQATSQRMRWSSGRMAIAYRYGFRLFLKGFAELDIQKMDASLQLLFPNPSMAANLNILFLLASLTLGKSLLTVWLLGTLVMQICIFCIGVAYTKNRFKNLLALFMAPMFLIWKMIIDALSVLGFGRKRWVRTERR